MSQIKIKNLDKIFACGDWESAHGEKIDLINPATEALYVSVTGAARQDIDQAVSAAREAFDNGPWPQMSPAERAALIRKLADGLRARGVELASAFTNQIGGLASLAPLALRQAIDTLHRHADYAEQYAWETRHPCSIPGHTSTVYREPVGVVAAICPWNMPLNNLVQKLAPALATGCTVVLKPAPESPLEAYIVVEVAQQVGFPDGVINLVVADREVSDYLASHPDVDKISFTGSTAVGKHIAAVAAERMARVTLELGGKSPALVLDDFSTDMAARILANSCVMHSGQICGLLSRAIVPANKHDEIAEKIAAFMRGIKVGSPADSDTQMGPVALKRQLERIASYVDIGIDEGAELRCGGKRPKHLDRGYYIEPTLFANVDNRMRIAQEEIFGPVLVLIPADDEEHAMALANDTVYGLNAAVLTRNAAKAREVGRQLRAGNVGHNGMKADFSLPVGGFKQSGIGREGGLDGLSAYTESKTMVIEQLEQGGGEVAQSLFQRTASSLIQ